MVTHMGTLPSPQEPRTREDVSEMLRRIRPGKDLTQRQEVELLKKAKAGDERAKRNLIAKNKRLVILVARIYRGKGLPLEDLIQEANIGLLEAIEKFDPERGHRFWTYAGWWVRRAAHNAMADKALTIRLPIYLGEKIRKIDRTYYWLSDELNHEPTDEEVAKQLEWSVQEVKDLKGAVPDVTSLEQLLSSEEGVSLLDDLVEDERTSDTPEEEVIRNMATTELKRAIERLPGRHRLILVLRYGLDAREPETLAELGKKLGVSKERVRQLQREAESMLASGLYERGFEAAA